MKTSSVCASVAAVCVAAVLSAFGAEISGDAAKGAVAGWVRLREALGDEIVAEPQSVTTYQGLDGVGEFHVVNLKDGGYVITSGDTEITPILGYSKTGTFAADENSPMWALLTADVAARAAALGWSPSSATANVGSSTLRSRRSATIPVSATAAGEDSFPASEWARLISAGKDGVRLKAKMTSTPTDLRVASFVQSKWSQTTANGRKYYNYYTPNNWPCGCVATVFAQTMRYFEFPNTSVTPKTFTCKVGGTATDLTMQGGTYDWAHMPYVPHEVTYDWNNVIGIAKLTSDAGISVCMSYNSGGSSSSSSRVGDSLVSTFGYSNAIMDYSNAGIKGNAFKQNVIPSLDAKLPVVLGIQGRPTGSATADAGHSILTDGYGYYNNQLYIHLNFGWSGSDDAWYTPADSDTGTIINASGYDFTNINCTVFNIFTNATQYSVIASGRVLDQSGEPIAGATVTAKYNSTTYATATSDARGVYALILPPTSSTRTYTVNATCSGYTSTGARSVSASRTVGDTARKEGNNYTGSIGLTSSNSNSYDNDITMESLGLPKLATPESPTATEFGTSASVTLTCATNGATIYYTLDGSKPTASSTLYTGPIALTKTTMVKALAIKSGYARSDVFTRTFVSAATIDECYFRYDFSDGTRQFIGSASQASDPLTADAGAANFVAAYGQDGSNTAVHVKSNAYGTDKIGGSSAAGKAVLAGDWTLAMSVRPGSVEKGLLFSLGRANDNNSKCVFLASSSTAGKIYVGTARKKGSANSYTGSVDRELAQEWGLTGASADTTSGYHSIVAVHSSGGMVAVYVDGELAGSVDTTENASGCVFGNGIQFNQAHGSSTFLSANGYSQSLNNPDVAFQDVRFYNFAFTAETAAAYAALYPATLPRFSNLDQYAYVQSYGVNGVDTGVYMTDTDKFTADFAFTDVSYKSWLCGAGLNANKQTHAIYLNGNQQLAWTTRGEWWWSTWPSAKIEGSTIEDTRLVMTVESSLTANLTYYDIRETKSSDASSKTATSTGPSIIPTHLFRANTMMDNDGQACKAKIYSFEVDADSSAITPRAFFAPTTDGNGAAGFTNVVAGTFHGECLSSPATALTFTSGVGRAEDYRYRSGKFYSRIYASSADSATGLVKFDGGEAAGTNAQYTTRGRTAKIVAVPAEYYAIDRWEGDTWAIADGSSATDAAIVVQSDTAIQLRAVFKYMRVSTPALGEVFSALFNGSATFALSCATEGASIYYTTNGTTPTVSSTLYAGTFSFNPESMFTTLKAIAVKDGWYDSDVFEVKLVNLAVAPKSAYAQAGSESLLLHLDAIENAGAGTHADSLAIWADLAGNHTVTETRSAGFQADAWTANGSSCFLTTSTAAKDALAAKAFTLELVISHPSTQNQYENWVFIGENNSHRQLSVDMRSNNSQNPLIQGVQYRESSWNGTRSTVPNKNGAMTKWNTRQYIAVVCDANGATAYYDGMNVLHTTAGGGVDPTTTEVSIGASFNGGNMLYNGSEICAVRMTSRALTEDERMRNFYVDSQRFGLEGAPAGYCIANGNVQVRITEGAEGFEFSTDGGTTWTTGEVWVDINTAVTLSARVAASTDQTVKFKNLPEGATTFGNSVTFTPTKPCVITVSAAQWTNNDGTGSFDNVANWIGGVPPAADDDFTVNISGDTVITVNEAYSLGIMTVKGTGSVTFTGTGSISATMLNVASNLTVDTCGKLTVTGVAGAGNVVLTPASDSITISSASTLTGDLTIKADSSVAFNVTAATSVSNFYVRAATNAVITMTVSGGSFKATAEAIVQHGILKQGSATVLGTTPKITVQDGGTFDINGMTIRQETPIYIAGAGAGDWPWALATSSAMASGNYLYDLHLTADATIGKGQFKLGRSNQNSFIYLNGHTLTAKSWLTLRCINTMEGTIDLQNSATVNA